VLKSIFDSNKGYVIDGCWRDLPEGAVGQSLQDLLFESRRVPEIVVILKCKEPTTFQRIIRYDEIKAEYERQVEDLRIKREQRKREARAAFEAGLAADAEKAPEDK
jgi:hypothetical protein